MCQKNTQFIIQNIVDNILQHTFVMYLASLRIEVESLCALHQYEPPFLTVAYDVKREREYVCVREVVYTNRTMVH